MNRSAPRSRRCGARSSGSAPTPNFARLYHARFPIRRMEQIDACDGNDYRSMAADNTSGFNCRYAVAAGPKHSSAHAYGDAIDVNPPESPYLIAENVYPPAGRRYLNRADVRPGMASLGGTLKAAFAAAGWQWGGRWTGSPTTNTSPPPVAEPPAALSHLITPPLAPLPARRS